jgi:hypothetical protein
MNRPFANGAAIPSLVLLVALSCAGGASAQSRAPVVQAVVDCRKVQDSVARLACYDRSVDDMAMAQTAGDLVTIDREQRGVLRKQAFGFNIPAITLFDRDRAAANDRLVAKVEAASRDGAGRWIIRLQDGAVWAQTDDDIVYPDPKPGAPVVVRRGALGSFFMSINGKPAVRATRRQ